MFHIFLFYIGKDSNSCLFRQISSCNPMFFAIALAVVCQGYGSAVPKAWQCCAKPKKKFGTNGVYLTGVKGCFLKKTHKKTGHK